MMYLDANVFITAATKEGSSAQKLIDAVATGKTDALTSTLTYDEFVWKILLYHGRNEAAKAGRAFLNLPNMLITQVDVSKLALAQKHIEEDGLNPRDAIHAACCVASGGLMVSEDRDFDGVKGLKRMGISEAVKRIK